MKKNILLLLLIIFTAFLTISCFQEIEEPEVLTPNIPAVFWGEWHSFSGHSGTMIFEIDKEHIWCYAKGNESYSFDACLSIQGAKEILINEYEYRQEYEDSSMTLKYYPNAEVLQFEAVYSSGYSIHTRYKYNLMKKTK